MLSGTIAGGSSLSQSMGEKGLSLALTDELEDALAQVYFPSAQPGDKWKIVYDQKYIDGKAAGSGHILACLLYTSPSPRDQRGSRMPSSA